MKQTEQYSLNQWELSDRVLMADFNADNAKIASALTALPNADGEYTLSLTDLNLGAHLILLLEIEGLDYGAWYYTLNKDGSLIEGTKTPVTGAMGEVRQTASQFLFFPMRCPDAKVWCQSLGSYNVRGSAVSDSYQYLRTLEIKPKNSSNTMSGRFVVRFYAIG